MPFDGDLTPKLKRAAPLRPESLTAARRALVDTLAEGNVSILNPTLVTEAVLRAFIAAERMAFREDGRISETAKELAAMKVGDAILTGPCATQTIRGRMVTARTLMDNPDAMWTSRTQSDGRIQVTRTTDGRRPVSGVAISPITLEIAAMAPGESKIGVAIKAVGTVDSLGTNHKAKARRMLGQADADWTVRSTTKGVRVTRVR